MAIRNAAKVFMTFSSAPFVVRPRRSYDVIYPRPSEHQSTTDGVMDEAELQRLHPASYAWSLSCRRRNRDEAEEDLQDVYVTIHEGKARFDGGASRKPWHYAVL